MPIPSLFRLLLCLFAIAFCASPSRAQEPKPTLRIETGMHSARILRIGTDRAGRYLVSGSDDKTVRVWDTETGALLSTLRVPLVLGSGQEGVLFSATISPDGGEISCGGWSTPQYVVDRKTGVARFAFARPNGWGIDSWQTTYSPDGKYIATVTDGDGMVIWRASDLQKIAQDAKGMAPSHDVDWDKSGRLVTASVNGMVRLYGADFRLIKSRKVRGGWDFDGAKFSPDGTRIVISGSRGDNRVEVLSSSDLSSLYSLPSGGIGDILRVAWSRDGERIYGAGEGGQIRCWSGQGRGSFTDYKTKARDRVTDVAPLPGGGVAFSAEDPAIGVLDADGRERFFHGNDFSPDFRGNGGGIPVSNDASVVQFPYQHGGNALARFSVPRRFLNTDVQMATGTTAVFPSPPTPERLRPVGQSINGIKIPLEGWDNITAHVALPSGRGVILGTRYYLHYVTAESVKTWSHEVPSEIVSLNVSQSGKILVAAQRDGTIHWYRASDGKELLTLFAHADRKRWIAWTPSGYYDCAPGSESLIGWQVNRGRERVADFYPVSQFRDTFYRPDVVERIIGAMDEGEALRLANAAPGAGSKKNTSAVVASITAKLPPSVTILSPEDGAFVNGNTLTVRFTVRSATDAPVTKVRVLVEGRPESGVRGLDFSTIKKDEGTEQRELSVVVPERDCEVALLAENKHGVSTAATVALRRKVSPPVAGAEPAFVAKPKLYILAVGVSKYLIPGKDLDFPAKDARDFVAVLKAQEGGLYREVSSKVITDKEATRDAVVDGLEWIERETTARDVAMVFLSGHGANDPEGNFYFLPHNFSDSGWKRTGVGFSDIRTALGAIKGKALFFVDSCHSGNVLGTAKAKGDTTDITSIVNELSDAENGVVVFAASTGRQVALEDPAWKNGAFTKAVIEAIRGGADYNKSGRITVNMLDLFVSERVKELTKGRQTPTTTKPSTVPDFPIAVKRD